MFPKKQVLLLDGLLPAELVDRLRADGHDVTQAVAVDVDQAKELTQLLAQADRERRTLVLLDADLAPNVPCAWTDRHPASGLVRVQPGTLEQLAERTIEGARAIPQMRWMQWKYGVLRPAVRRLEGQGSDPPDEE
jgi:uncharacterized protein (DUF2336 family)